MGRGKGSLKEQQEVSLQGQFGVWESSVLNVKVSSLGLVCKECPARCFIGKNLWQQCKDTSESGKLAERQVTDVTVTVCVRGDTKLGCGCGKKRHHFQGRAVIHWEGRVGKGE